MTVCQFEQLEAPATTASERPSPRRPDTPMPSGIAVRAEVHRGAVLLTGVVPEDSRSELVTDIAVVVPPSRITDRLRSAAIQEPAGRKLAACAAVVRTLAVAASAGAVLLAGDRMEVTGVAVTAAGRPTLEAAVALARSAGLHVIARLTGTRPAPGVFGGLALDSLRFEPGRCALSGTACQVLDQVAAELKRYFPLCAARATRQPGVRVRIDGHADPREAAEPGALSARRAEIAVAHLVRRGIPREWLSVRGFGATRPAVPGGPDPDRRRIEITVIGV